MVRILEPFEEHDSRVETLSIEEVAALEQSPLRLEIEYVDRDQYRIATRQFVGTDAGSVLHVSVRPKLPVSRLLYVLSEYPEGLEFGQWTQHSESSDTLAVLRMLLIEALDRGLANGLPRDYVARSGDEMYLHGTLDSLELVTRRFGVLPPIPCAFDDYTADIETNRRLLAAARLMEGTVPDADARSRLSRIVSRLAESVARVRYGRSTPPISPGSLPELQLGHGAKAYRVALDLAQLVLRNGTLETHPGGLSSVSFVIDMNVAFERFVSRTLHRTLGIPGGLWKNTPLMYLDHGETIRIRPDVVWYAASDRPTLVVDAKWKSTVEGHADDVKQVALYCVALGLKHGVLVYGQAAAGALTHEVKNSEVVVHVVHLDVDGTPDDIRRRVSGVGRLLADLAVQST